LQPFEVVDRLLDVSEEVATVTVETPPTVRAMEELYRDHWAPLLKMAFFMVGDRALAEDLVQDAFLRLARWKHLPEHPDAYLRKVVVNLAHDWRRRLAVERRHLGPGPSPTFNPEIDEMWHRLWRLPVRERQALALRYYGNFSLAEVADSLGCPLGTAKSLIHRGLSGLRTSMEGH
jgi:DNA-directed RNA polymerase specialized sigma24 family protein